MQRYLNDRIREDLVRKMVVLTGSRQVGKTTLARSLMQGLEPAAYLNWDVAADRAVLQRQAWPLRSRLVVMDEIHKMPYWKQWLKGVVDGRAPGQALLVTGSARMDTFRQSGESLAGRYFAYQLHPSLFENGASNVVVRQMRRCSGCFCAVVFLSLAWSTTRCWTASIRMAGKTTFILAG